MCSRGKYELLESESEAKPSSKRISALKIFYVIGFVSAFTFIAFIYFQDFVQNASWQTYEPKPTDAPPTNRTFLEEAPTACGVIINEGPMIKVGDLNTYVTGSYMDHRFREIKSIAIVYRQQLVTYSCVLCCNGKNVTTLAQYAIHSDHFGFEYGTATITCPLNDECLKPTHVAVTSSSSANHSESITSFQSIMNRDVPAAFPHQFTVCISVMYDYTNVLNLVEAMEMFRLLGATRVAIYLTNCDSNVQKVLDYYVERGFVEVIPWTIKKHVQVSSGWRKPESEGELHYYGQIPALNDCVYRYMYQSRYVALHDMDELILPFGVKTWTEMLPKLEKMYGTTFGFEFENNQFPFTSKADRRYDVNEWESVRGTNILKYIQRVPNNPNAYNNFKVIVNPRLVLMATVHGLLDTVNVGKHTVRVNRNVARMYHSKNFTYPPNTNLIPDDHLWDYADELIPAVTKVLQDCGFITG